MHSELEICGFLDCLRENAAGPNWRSQSICIATDLPESQSASRQAFERNEREQRPSGLRPAVIIVIHSHVVHLVLTLHAKCVGKKLANKGGCQSATSYKSLFPMH